MSVKALLMIVRAACGLLIPILFSSSTLEAASISLEWDASPSPEVVGYLINVSLKNGSTTVSYDVGSATGGRVDNLIPGSTYHIYATAYDADGHQSGPSNVLIYSVPQDPAGTFIQSDRQTCGSWKGVYGNEGYWMVGAPASLPVNTSVVTDSPQWV